MAYLLFEVLMSQGVITAQQVQSLVKLYESEQLVPIEGLIQRIGIKSDQIAKACADYYQLPAINLSDVKIESLLKLHQAHSALHLVERQFLPISEDDHELRVALSDPKSLGMIDRLQFQCHKSLTPHFAPYAQWQPLYHRLKRLVRYHHFIDSAQSGCEQAIIDLVNYILEDAIDHGASDVHFEPQKQHLRLRMRVDGLLQTMFMFPSSFKQAVTSRLKILGGGDITEKRLPQDGHFSFVTHNAKNQRDCRLSSCPTLYGEKCVVRLLNPKQSLLDIKRLGFSEESLIKVQKAYRQPQGMILVTGPTGSGKTMTLYTLLNEINTPEKNISTIENPVELMIDGINQINTHHQIGLNFASVLKTLLRQDPDVIMVGEIRDKETAEIAIKASNTGHLVLATLHTNHCAETIIRLVQMGMAPFQIASSLSLIIAQRLLRKLCSHCHGRAHHQPYACRYCDRGYCHRIAVFEVMPITEAIKQHLLQPQLNTLKLQTIAKEQGVKNLWESGLLHVKKKITTLEELNRVLQH